MLLSINRNRSQGFYNNAKPILLLAIISLIEDDYIQNNRIYFDDVLVQKYYEILCKLDDTPSVTPIEYPYYYLRKDSFYTLHLYENNEGYKKTPSVQYLKRNVEYASFDNGLWDLLRDDYCRNELRQDVLRFYFGKTE